MPRKLGPSDASTWPEAVDVDIDTIRVGQSPRLVVHDPDHVQVLAATVQTLPPILVHRSTMCLIDGRHRLMAARLRGARTIKARWFEGTEEEAYVESVRTNIAHGKPLSLHERELAAAKMLEVVPDWSDRAVAEACGLSPKTVAALRTASAHKTSARLGRDGRRRPVDPGGIRLQVADLLESDPDASVDELARTAGTSPGTVRDVRRRLRRGADPLPARLRAKAGDDQKRHWAPPTTLATPLRDDNAFAAEPMQQEFAQWFDGLDIEDDDWARFVDEVPLSRAYDCIDEAIRRAVSWRLFADALQARIKERYRVQRA